MAELTTKVQIELSAETKAELTQVRKAIEELSKMLGEFNTSKLAAPENKMAEPKAEAKTRAKAETPKAEAPKPEAAKTEAPAEEVKLTREMVISKIKEYRDDNGIEAVRELLKKFSCSSVQNIEPKDFAAVMAEMRK